MKNKLFAFLLRHKKWSILVLYLVTMLVVWLKRKIIIYQHIPFQLPMQLLDFVLLVFAFIGLVFIVQMLRLPPLTKWQFQRAVESAGIHNGNGAYPVLISVSPDRHKEHGKRFRLNNMGISVLDLSSPNNLARLEAALNGKIYKIDYGRRSSRTLLYILPRRFVKPYIISLDSVELAKEPNFLVVGKTGSGKSYALMVLLGIYSSIPGVHITICDYKKSSFAQFSDSASFYGYEEVPEGIRVFYEEFKYRLAANEEERNKKIRVLLIDEYGALISAQDKKTADELKTMVSNMLFMGRSLGIRVLIGVQRADAEHFKAGARDQARAILGLGNLSKEQKQMLFSDYKDSMDEHNGLGEGYLLIDGQDIERVQVAEIKDMEMLNYQIRLVMGGADGEA